MITAAYQYLTLPENDLHVVHHMLKCTSQVEVMSKKARNGTNL